MINNFEAMLFDHKDDDFYLGEGYFPLEKTPEKFLFNFKYLLNMATKGKLKAFKVGDIWYTSEVWINEHKKNIINLIDHEIGQSRESLKRLQKWVRRLK